MMDLLTLRKARPHFSDSRGNLHAAKEEKYASLRSELMALRDARDHSSPSTPCSMRSGWSPPGSAVSLASTASSIGEAQFPRKAQQKRSSKDRLSMTKLDQQRFPRYDEQLAKTWSMISHAQSSSGSKLDSKLSRSWSSGALLKASSSMVRLSPVKIERPMALPNLFPKLQMHSQATACDARSIRGIALLDWAPQINLRVKRNSGMLGRLAALKALAIKAASQIQEHKFQLQMLRQTHQKALTQGLEVDVNSFLPICDETTLAPANKDVPVVEPEEEEEEEADQKDSEQKVGEDTQKCDFSIEFSIECSMAKWEPVSMSKSNIVFSDGKNELHF